MAILKAALPVVLLSTLGGAALGAEAPVAASPGDASKVALIADACPTFSWGGESARGYELVVYRLGEEGEEANPVLRQIFPGTVLSWTPALDRCLERGGRYAWSVRAVGGDEPSDWSAPALFEVAAGPTRAEFEAALEMVRQYLAGQESAATGAARPASAVAAPQGAASTTRPEATRTPSSAASRPTTRVPEAPAEVSLTTSGAIGAGTPTPLADLHVVGDAASGGILVAPDAPGGGGVSELLLAEDDDGTYGMSLKYDGAANLFHILAEFEGTEFGPYLTVDAFSGTITFGLPLFGVGSGLTSVNAETLDGMDSTAFSTGLHTTDTNAATLCGAGQHLDGDGTCKTTVVASDLCPLGPPWGASLAAACSGPYYFAFVTSTVFTGDLVTAANNLGLGPFGPTEGLAAGDAICQLHAQNGGLAGSYRAWLSDSGSDAIDRFVDPASPWLNVHGGQVAANKTALVTCSPDCLDTPITYDETGTATTGLAWTGTLDGSGLRHTKHCAGWTDGSFGDGGSAGQTTTEGPSWSGQNMFSSQACGLDYPLYCFRQTVPDNAAPGLSAAPIPQPG